MPFVSDNPKLSRSCCLQYLVIIISFFLFLACAQAPAPIPSPEITLALKRLEKAELLFQEQQYPEALAIYLDHLRRFPRGPNAETALMKAGLVYMATGDYPRAQQAFSRLVRKHRKSPLVYDARFNLVLAYYKEGNYNAAIKYARSALRFSRTVNQKFRIRNLMGYCYIANKMFKQGITSYMDAYKLAKLQERTEILSKVKEVITYLKEPELNSLLDIYRKTAPGGYLRLQLAKEYASEDRIETAINVLSDFIRLFPDHDELETATTFIEELKSRALVDRFSIGCVLPITGPYSTFGNRALMGIELALDEFNTQPDVNPIQLIIKDSKGDPNEAASAVESLALEHSVIGIIGPLITSESAAIKAQSLEVPIMTLTQKPDITKLGDYVFRNFLTPSLQVQAIVAYAVQELGIKKFAILYPEERYGISFMNRFWDELMLHGAEIVAIESYGLDQTDFADDIKKLVGLYYPRPEEESIEYSDVILEFLSPDQEDEGFLPGAQEGDTPQLGPLADETALTDEPAEPEEKGPEPIIDFEAVFIPDTFEKVVMIAPQFPYEDVADLLLLGTNLWHSDKLIQMARSYVQGAVVPGGFFGDSPSSRVQGFVNGFRKVFGTSPKFLEAQAYDSASILFQLVNHPEVRSRRTLKTSLTEVRDFPGVTGLTSFDDTGDVSKEIYLLKLRGRRFVQIKP